MNKNIHFLAGLPRCGSTILGSILSQHPDVFVSKSSFALNLLGYLENAFGYNNIQNIEWDVEEELIINNVYKACLQGMYQHRSEKHVFDKHHDWQQSIKQLEKIIDSPKVIFLYRPTAEIVTSYLNLIDKDPNNNVDKRLREAGKKVNHFNRVEHIIPNTISCYLSNANLLINRKKLLFISYDEIVDQPVDTVNKIYNYCGIDLYSKHDFENIEPACQETKDMHGFKDMRKIRPKLEKTSWENPKDHLHKVHWNLCQEYDKKLQKIIQDSE